MLRRLVQDPSAITGGPVAALPLRFGAPLGSHVPSASSRLLSASCRLYRAAFKSPLCKASPDVLSPSLHSLFNIRLPPHLTAASYVYSSTKDLACQRLAHSFNPFSRSPSEVPTASFELYSSACFSSSSSGSALSAAALMLRLIRLSFVFKTTARTVSPTVSTSEGFSDASG